MVSLCSATGNGDRSVHGLLWKRKVTPSNKGKKYQYLISLLSLWWSLWNGRCKLLTEQVQHFWACALSLFNLLWKRLLLWGDFCHGNNAEHCSTQHRFKEEQAVSPGSGEGCFCFDMRVPAVIYLLCARFLKPGHLIHLSWSLLNGFPEVCSGGCGAWFKQLASLAPENNHDKSHLLYEKPGKNMGSHSGTAGHITGETSVKARNCSAHSLAFEQFWVTGFITTRACFPTRFCDPSLRAARSTCRSSGT